MKSGLAVRILAVLVALVACAWFALGIRQAHDADLASDIITGTAHVGPAAARRASSLLDAAGQLNPDHSVALLRSQLALREGDAARARAIALGVARAEPQNIDAWLAFNSASANRPRLFLLALKHVNELARFPRTP